MNSLEAQLDYPFGETLPDAGTKREVAPGVYWLRMTLPFALNHINLWLLDDHHPETGAGGWTVIDCGVANEVTRANWETIFANELDGKPIIRVLATHYHPDHLGLAEWLCTRWDAQLWMSAGEYTFARLLSAGLPGTDGRASRDFFARHGFNDPALLEQLQARSGTYPQLVPALPATYRRVQDGQLLAIAGRDWRVITGFGHAPEHVALYSAELNVLISGDMVLPRISTNVSVFPLEPESNPVHQYLESLEKFAGLPEDVLVLPSHGKPFRGMHVRIGQLNDHHAARLAEVLEACARPCTAADIVPIMFPRALDVHQLSFAAGEALAHLHMLWLDGALRRERNADGGFHFVRAE